MHDVQHRHVGYTDRHFPNNGPSRSERKGSRKTCKAALYDSGNYPTYAEIRTQVQDGHIPTGIHMVDRIGIAIQVLVERQRQHLAARVLVHADEAPRLRVVVPGPEVVQPRLCIEYLARVAVQLFLCCGVLGVAKGVVVQQLQDLPLRVGDDAGAALGVGVDLLALALYGLPAVQAQPFGAVGVAAGLPGAAAAAVLAAAAFEHDLAVGAAVVQYPLGLPGCLALARLVQAAADASAQCVVAVADAVAGLVADLQQPVVAAPAVAGFAGRAVFFQQVAAGVPAVAGGLALAGFFRELVQFVVAVVGDLALAGLAAGALGVGFLQAVAGAVVAVADAAGVAAGAGADAGGGGAVFLQQFAVRVVVPLLLAFDGRGAVDFFLGGAEAPGGVALVGEARQLAAVGAQVADLFQLACAVVAVVAAGAAGALDFQQAAGRVVAVLARAFGAAEALQAAGGVPAGLLAHGGCALAGLGEAGAEGAALAGGVPAGFGLALLFAGVGLLAQLPAQGVQLQADLAALAVVVVVGAAVAVVAYLQAGAGPLLAGELALAVVVAQDAAVGLAALGEVAVGVVVQCLLQAPGQGAAGASAGQVGNCQKMPGKNCRLRRSLLRVCYRNDTGRGGLGGWPCKLRWAAACANGCLGAEAGTEAGGKKQARKHGNSPAQYCFRAH